MSMQLSPEGERYIQSVIAAGLYPDATQAIDEAIRLLRRRDQIQSALDEGQADLAEGRVSPAEEVLGRLQKRAAELADRHSAKSEP